MAQVNGVILCLAYILGLLSTTVAFGGYVLLGLGIVLASLLPRYWRTGPKAPIWLIAGLCGLLATVWWQVRSPHPVDNDVSQFLTATNQPQWVTVQGYVQQAPSLTRNQQAKFFLTATNLKSTSPEQKSAPTNRAVSGKIYVTAPLLQATGLRPGQLIQVAGSLYQPKPALNPGSFDFQAYLAREGCFAGLKGQQIDFVSGQPQQHGSQVSQIGWQLRQRIVKAQVRWLDSPAGPLVSAMILGRRAVDLPYDIRDAFTRVGLAHTLAASGFHVSMVLGLVTTLTQALAVRTRFCLGIGALVFYVGLTGIQPSVMRAAWMGAGALVGLLTQRQVKPLNLLLLTAILLLLYQPDWIWNLGFQLSFLATLGLLITAQPLTQKLDWLPPTIASLVAVPLAAYLWTLPLQLYVFGVIPLYSIGVNILATPLVIVISIGGIISALAALLWSEAGSAIAWLLYYPIQSLISLVNSVNQLPGSTLTIGTISLVQLLTLYTLWGLGWLQPWFRKRLWFIGLMALSLVIIPLWYGHATLVQVTVFATSGEPMVVVQDHGNITLINNSRESTTQFTLLPFLRQQGIHQIDWAIAPDLRSEQINGWQRIQAQTPIQTFYTPNPTHLVSFNPTAPQLLPTGKVTPLGNNALQLINPNPTVLQYQIQDQHWLLAHHLSPPQQTQLVNTGQILQGQVLWWSGEPLAEAFLAAVRPEVAIATTTPPPETLTQLKQHQIQLFRTDQDGAIQWNPKRGFETVSGEEF
ncbi:MAG: DUF4131 domain-containing protein [Cyanothece sp. SIO1E1]|nr:DUF4131 domain-containing protein [Cyanothece sp. SIO1E1]